MIQREFKKSKDHVHLRNKYSNITQFYETLKQFPNALTLKRKDGTSSGLEIELLQSSSKCFHLALYDSKLVQQLLEKDNFCDATFSICPNVEGVKQIFIAMGKKCNVVSMQIKHV